MELLNTIVQNPVDSLQLAAMVAIIVFQMASAGLLNLRIGKESSSERGEMGHIEHGDLQGQINHLYADVAELKEDVKIIRENHLAHIQEDMARMREDISYIKGKLAK